MHITSLGISSMQVDCQVTPDKITIIRPRHNFISMDDINNLDMWIGIMRNVGAQRIIYDLRHVRQINSMAIGLLMGLHAYLDAHDSRLILVNLNTNIKEMFLVSEFSLVFEIYDSVPDALTAMRS